MRIIFLSFFFLLIAKISYGEEVIINPVQIGAQVSLFLDEDRRLTVDEVQSQHFEKVNAHDINLGFTNDACWLQFQLVNTSSESQRCYLKAGKLLVDTIQLFSRESDEWKLATAGVNIPQTKKPVRARSSYFPIELDGGESRTVFLRAASTYGIEFSLSIVEDEELRVSDTTEALTQGFYLGALLIITLYNLFLGFSVNDRLYTHYALANFAAIMTALSIRGFFSYYVPGDYVGWTSMVVTGTSALYIVLSANFNIRILNLRRYSRSAYYVMLAIVGITVLLTVVLILIRLNGNIVHNGLLAYAHIVFTVAAIYAGIVAYMNGSYYAKYYLIGWTLLLFSVLLYSLVISGYIERNYFTANLYLIGSVLEVLLLSFALADRYNYILTERNALKADLKNKEGDLAMVISDNRIRHQFGSNILQEVQKILRSNPNEAHASLRSFANDLKLQLKTEEKLDYVQDNIDHINTEFVNKMRDKFPQLSQSELEICSLVKLNLSVKEIARLRKTSEGAIRVTKHRIRKKMGDQEGDLNEIIQKL